MSENVKPESRYGSSYKRTHCTHYTDRVGYRIEKCIMMSDGCLLTDAVNRRLSVIRRHLLRFILSELS